MRLFLNKKISTKSRTVTEEADLEIGPGAEYKYSKLYNK